MKFILAIGATIVLLLHQFTAVAVAARRASGAVVGTLPAVGPLGTQLVADAGLAVLVLLVATALSVYKPWGLTPYGQRKQLRHEVAYDQTATTGLPTGLKIFLAMLALLMVAFGALHHSGPHHGH
jgi:hypothetical protein